VWEMGRDGRKGRHGEKRDICRETNIDIKRLTDIQINTPKDKYKFQIVHSFIDLE